MKYLFIFIILVFSLSSCRTHERIVESISCKANIILQFDKTTAEARREGRVADKKLEAFRVYFLNNFDDQVRGYVNDKLLFDEKIETNKTTSNTHKSFGYNYSKDTNTPIIKIEIVEKNICFDIEIDKKYKIVYVFLTSENNWIVRFSNEYYLHN